MSPSLAALHADLAIEYRLANRSEKTIAWYAGALLSFATYMQRQGYQRCDVQTFQPRHVNSYILELHARELSDHSVNSYVRALRGFSSWLWRKGHTSENRLADLRSPKTTSLTLEILSEREVVQLVMAIRQHSTLATRDEALLVLMLDTGLRASEVLSLTMRRMDLAGQRITVTGKGKKQRALPIGETTRRAIEQYMRSAHSARWVFTTDDGRALTVYALKNLFRRMRRWSGIQRVHPHLLRHTFACRWLLAHNDPLALQTLLGHSSLAMTQHYVKIVAQLRVIESRRATPMDLISLPE